MKRIGAVVTAVLLASFFISVSARQKPQPIPRFRAGVELVLLDVSVLDRDRMPVRGLAAEDFTVLEDGQPQEIETFSAIDLPEVITSVEAPARWVREVAPDVQRNTDFDDSRVVVIVLDDATPMAGAEIPRAKQATRRVVERLGPTDLACVIYALEKKSGQEFTRDKAKLVAAIDRFNGSIDATPFDAFNVESLTLYLAAVDTVRGVSEYLADLPARRKALFWVSVGLPLDLEAAQAQLIVRESPENASKSGAALTLIRAAQDALIAAQRANVTVYGLDPGGLRAPNDMAVRSADSAHPGMLNGHFLTGFSAASGGFAIIDTNDPLPGISQVFRENGSYYLLGYVSPNRRAAGRFRKVEVRVTRPGTTVRARNGYFEASPRGTAKAVTPVSPVDIALAAFVPKTDLALQLTAAPFAIPGRRESEIAVVLGVSQPAPTRATRVVQRVEFEVAAFGPDGRRRAGRREAIDATLNVAGLAKTVGYETFARLNLEPGRYYLRAAAESRLHGVRLSPSAPEVFIVKPGEGTTDLSGSVYYDLDVPDFLNQPLSLSGVVLAVTPQVASGPKDRLASLVPILPTSLREFTNGDRVTAFLRVYQGGGSAPGTVLLTPRVVDATGTTMAEKTDALEAQRFAKDRTADYLLDLPMERLKPGPHLLTIEAKSGNKVVRRDVRFEVR